MASDDFSIKELLIENRGDTKYILGEVAVIKEHLRTLNGRVAKSEAKIEDLRTLKWKLIGAATVISLIMPFIITYITR